MSYVFPPDIRAEISRRLVDGRYASEDDLLRDALRALSEEDADLSAVRDAIDEWQAGDPGLSLDEAFDQIRRSLPT